MSTGRGQLPIHHLFVSAVLVMSNYRVFVQRRALRISSQIFTVGKLVIDIASVSTHAETIGLGKRSTQHLVHPVSGYGI